MSEIKVTYDGSWPCACGGRLVISIGDREVYNKEFCCNSSGSCGVNEEGDESTVSGSLDWADAQTFPPYIRRAVAKVLDEVEVCCGGCI